MKYILYSKHGLVLGTFESREAALYAYNNWSQAWTLFENTEVIRSKW